MRSTMVVAMSLVLAACGVGDEGDFTEDGPLDEASAALGGRSRPCAAHPVHRQVTLPTGVTLAYVEQGNKSGDPFIFLHGYSDSHRSFDLTLPKVPRNIRAFALDQRGHGDSSRPACCYTQGDFAGDVVAFMDALRIRRATLVGHSMGSLIAHKVAAEHPSRVDKLVLIGSAPTLVGNEVGEELGAFIDTLEDPVDPEFVYDFQAGTFYRPVPASYLEAAVEESLKLPAAVWRQTFAGMLAEDHASRLARIRAKTFVFWGDQDVFFSAADQASLVSKIPRARLITYRQTGHGLHVEEPTRFVRDLLRFTR